ncbi:hypothetical protein HMPREF2700_07760 [Neisseria sp. HMSC068C04]|nr:hypothetical protein HMPREF2700_07760 [Neisseria sp. HMSC068C04]
MAEVVKPLYRLIIALHRLAILAVVLMEILTVILTVSPMENPTVNLMEILTEILMEILMESLMIDLMTDQTINPMISLMEKTAKMDRTVGTVKMVRTPKTFAKNTPKLLHVKI